MTRNQESDWKTLGGSTLEPVSNHNNIAICFGVDSQYTIPLVVAITSLIKKASYDFYYDIVILHTGLSASSKQRILQVAPPPPRFADNVKIRFINIAKEVEEVPEYMKQKGHMRSAYYRFFIPEIFCNYEKVLWLDADIVICHDLAGLYQTKLTNNEWLGAVLDVYVRMRCLLESSYKEEVRLLLNDPMNYFQSGVILFNIKPCIENSLLEKCFLQVQSIGHPMHLDQDILNICCQSHVHFLDPKWNVEWSEMNSTFPELLKKGINLHGEDRAHLMNLNNPYILHMTGSGKPWKDPGVKYGTKWWEITRSLPDYEGILTKAIFCYILESLNKNQKEDKK